MGSFREKMEEVKKRIALIRVVGDAGAGMVTVTAS
ncbi:YbaB/EbfC DNA-binding domain protein, partial [Leptospira kirschneri str. 200801925]